MTYSSDDPTLVSYPLARSAYEYIMRMKDLGALEGALGEMSLLPALQPIVEAIHVILAGGSVDVKVTARANLFKARTSIRRTIVASHPGYTDGRP